MLTQTLDYFKGLPMWELIAVATALFYVVYAARESIWCWPAALVSTVIYTVIFYDVFLWMDSLLHVYYIVMALYGWYAWSGLGNKGQGQANALPIQSWPVIFHVQAIIVLLAISLGLGWFMATYTPTHFPYLDSLTTVFAVFTTYLVAKKVLENWLYWVVIDAVSIYLYIAKDLQPTAVLFMLYTVIAAVGYYQWYKRYHGSLPETPAENQPV